MMNNNGSIYVAHDDAAKVAQTIATYMQAQGFAAATHRPSEMSGRIFPPDKQRRLFFVLPASDGWVTVWEDPRYFGDRFLAQGLARALNTRAVWIEVAGNGVAWARGIYEGAQTLEERYDEMETTFYGEYGTLHFAFDIDDTPEDFIERLQLPYPALHYESVLDNELPVEAGEPLFLAFERAGIDAGPNNAGPSATGREAQ